MLKLKLSDEKAISIYVMISEPFLNYSHLLSAFQSACIIDINILISINGSRINHRLKYAWALQFYWTLSKYFTPN